LVLPKLDRFNTTVRLMTYEALTLWPAPMMSLSRNAQSETCVSRTDAKIDLHLF